MTELHARRLPAPAPTPALTPLLTLAFAALLAGCGGGEESVVPTVSSATARPAGTLGGDGTGTGTYGQKILVTVNGQALDNGITVLSNACSGITRLTAAPTESNSTTAYYECTLTASGTVTLGVLRDISGFVLATVPVAVPAPQVTMTVASGLGSGASSLGSFVITLNPNQTPATVRNFLDYVNAGFYVGTVFHRNSPDFVIQGGGYAGPLAPTDSEPALKTTNPAIVLEDNSGLSNVKWTVAMARTNAPNSATSQFFVNLADNLFLDRTASARGYAVLGTVSAGTEVVTAMTNAACVDYPALLPSGDCLPLPNLVITAARQTR